MPIDETETGAPNLPIGWRFKVGIVLFALALVPYGLLAPVVFYKLPLATVATLVGAGVMLQKVIFVGAVAVLGKSGFATLKKKLFAKLAPADEVGPVRYRIGLVMFMLPILQGLVETYASHAAPHLVADRLWVDVAMDIILIASVFVLGKNFCDKIRAIFVPEAYAVLPEDKSVGHPAAGNAGRTGGRRT